MSLTCLLCIGLPVCDAASQAPIRPNVSNSVDKCDLVADRLLGAAMSSPVVVSEPAWLGSQCWVKYTKRSSGVVVWRFLLPPCTACSQCANSVAADAFVFLVASFTENCWMLAAVARPWPYRASCWLSLSCSVVLLGAMEVAHSPV